MDIELFVDETWACMIQEAISEHEASLDQPPLMEAPTVDDIDEEEAARFKAMEAYA